MRPSHLVLDQTRLVLLRPRLRSLLVLDPLYCLLKRQGLQVPLAILLLCRTGRMLKVIRLQIAVLLLATLRVMLPDRQWERVREWDPRQVAAPTAWDQAHPIRVEARGNLVLRLVAAAAEDLVQSITRFLRE